MKTPGLLTAKYAALVSDFGLRMHEIYDLTPRQIAEVYFHPRTSDGSIKVPELPLAAGADRLSQLFAFASAVGMTVTPEQRAELTRRLEARPHGEPDRTA